MMPELTNSGETMPTASDPRNDDTLFDENALVSELAKLAEEHGGSEQELRRAVVQPLKAVLNAGRARADEILLKDRKGRHCAERLCRLQDEILRVLFEFVVQHLYPSENPAEAERMAIVATGGYGRGLLAPGHKADINVIDFDALALKRPEVVYDLPAGGRRLVQRAEGYRHVFNAGVETLREGLEAIVSRHK